MSSGSNALGTRKINDWKTTIEMKTIEQYIEIERTDEIANKKDLPSSLSVLALGIGMWVLLCVANMDDGLTGACLFIALTCTVAGIILTGMSFSGVLSHYVYLPTRSRMYEKKVYINNIDYSQVVEALSNGGNSDIKSIVKLLWPLANSSHAIRILASRDKACALVQAGRNNTGHFEPETDVRMLTCSEVMAIQSLLK